MQRSAATLARATTLQLTRSRATAPVPAVAATRACAALRHFSSSAAAAPPSSATPATPAAPASGPASSFIAHAKQHGASSLLGPFRCSGGFDSCLSGMEVTRVDSSAGEVEAVLPITRLTENSYGTLHGGAISTLVDVLGTMALLARDHTRGGVSVDLNVNFLAAAKVGERVRCVGRVLKLGRTLGFTQVELFNEQGKLLAVGRHTKAM